MTKKEFVTAIYKYDFNNVKSFSLESKLKALKKIDDSVLDLDEELCFYIQTFDKPIGETELNRLNWLVGGNSSDTTHDNSQSFLRSSSKGSNASNLQSRNECQILIEVGPRVSLCTPFSTNATSIIRTLNPRTLVHRIEQSTIYKLELAYNASRISNETLQALFNCLHDPMVQEIYAQPITTFQPNAPRQKVANGEVDLQPCSEVDILRNGEIALRDISKRLGLFFDDWDISYYTDLFSKKIKRNPTIVECFDLAQSNSEHSRHWFFKGILNIEGRISHIDDKIQKTSHKQKECLFSKVASTQEHSNKNNVIKFEDNSSVIEGFDNLSVLKPVDSRRTSEMKVHTPTKRHILLTAETHNFPTGVAPFPGAATGTGGRIRDVQATGRGAHVVAGTAGYSFGNLLLDKYDLPWEDCSELYPNKLATPAKIAIEASNGASDYGNKFGEPIVAGFARSFGMRLKSNTSPVLKTERWEYLKPIMFTGGLGTIDDINTKKLGSKSGMQVAKVGGPVYRIGIGGGAASSADEGKKDAKLDFNAVQRGDPEMGQKLNRFIRACAEQSSLVANSNTNENPILSIHDQGAGGNCNVLKEIVEPNGAIIDANKFTLGDNTVNILEIWAAEYQESNAILIENSKKTSQTLNMIAKREKCNIDIVGDVCSDGKIKLLNFNDFDSKLEKKFPIDLKLEHVIGKMPSKVFNLKDYNANEYLAPVKLSSSVTRKISTRKDITQESVDFLCGKTKTVEKFYALLTDVLRLPSVASKRYLTSKVDRCVSGLIAGQQCLGPLHTPIADYALIAMSHFDTCGSVTSIGEQPIKGLVSPVSNASMSVAEALTNMMFCVITSIKDIKCSANWMWAAKLDGEGAKLVDACDAMCELMNVLGIAVDGGKDSLSMTAKVMAADARQLKSNINDSKRNTNSNIEDEIVKSPGTLVISAYAPVPDISLKVTPILKCAPKRSHLLYVNLSHPISLKNSNASNLFRLGGSAILQTLGQIGEEAPNIDHPQILRDGFNLIQELIKSGKCTAGHDISDGGLIVCALEMAIASHCGLRLNIKAEKAFRSLAGADELQIFSAMFSEECGAIIEVTSDSVDELQQIINQFELIDINAQRIGFGSYEDQRVELKFEYQTLLEHPNNHSIRDLWESTSKQLEFLQTRGSNVVQEYDNLNKRPCEPKWELTFEPNETNIVTNFDSLSDDRPTVAVIREEGINGDREMIASLVQAGFKVFDLTLTDLIEPNSKTTLSMFNGLVFPGGFSYADVFGSGRGWAASFRFIDNLRKQLIDFRKRPDTFSLGVCNGCQLMALLGMIDEVDDQAENQSSVKLEANDSGRFECRFVNVRIESTTNAIMFDGMEGSLLGIWIAHGEGKFNIAKKSVYDDRDTRCALRYTDDVGNPTIVYPFNPNGSEDGVAGMCSKDGRHLAIMPHPERCTNMWQWPYYPRGWNSVKISPWMRMFTNAYEFCKSFGERRT